MVRSLIGGLVAGLAMFLLGFVFWATPLSEIAFAKADDAQSAAVQAALAQNLAPSGTGTYVIPSPSTPQGTELYGRGPVAMVHFNTAGFAAEDMSMMLPGLLFAFASGILMSLGISAVGRENSFAQIARMVLLFSVGITLWTILSQPVFSHFGWGYWVYSFIAETVALVVGGLIIARWFVPRDPPPVQAEIAPAEG